MKSTRVPTVVVVGLVSPALSRAVRILGLLGLASACGAASGTGTSVVAGQAANAEAGASGVGVPLPGTYYHSVFPGEADPTGEEDRMTPADVDSYEQAVDRTVAWVYFSHNWYAGRSFPLEKATWIRARGAVPYIRLMLRSSNEQDVEEPVYTLEAIAAGAFDADLAAWGDAARDFGTPLIVEYGTEMNGQWFAWNGVWNGGADVGPERFRSAYRHIVETMRSRGADNLTWVFHANADDIPEDPWNAFENYYPGPDVVDWLGVSVYGATTPLDDECPPFADVMDQVVPRLTALAPEKPIFVLEFGVTAGNAQCDAASWADQAFEAILSDRWTGVRGFSWWNEGWQNDENPAHDTDMRVQTVPGLADVFRARLATPKVLDRPLIE